MKNALEDKAPAAGGPSSGQEQGGNVKQLQARLKHFEKMLAESEKERVDLKTRALMAES